MMEEEIGRLRITAYRGGSIAEISQFLSDLENAYLALYAVERPWNMRPLWHSFPAHALLESGFPFHPSGHPDYRVLGMDAVPPNSRLTLERVRIESLGFWEFRGLLNLLEQIRRYLNDRHERRKDREYRESSERERLELENQLIQQQLDEGGIQRTRRQVELLREMGYSAEEIRELIWQHIGLDLTRLARHQDTGLIGGENIDEPF
jgi:hypothetical protein